MVFTSKETVDFTLISFHVLKWDDLLSVKLPFELKVRILVQLLLELEANWLSQNVNELEVGLPRMWMKQPLVAYKGIYARCLMLLLTNEDVYFSDE